MINRIIKIKNKEVKEYSKPFLVAEIGNNFNGSIKLAKKMILAAKKAGADAVKFQSCNKDTILQKKIWENSPSPIPEFKCKDAREFEDFIALDEKKIIELHRFCLKNNILFSSTVFCKNDVDLLSRLSVPFFKIASMDLNHHLLIDYVAKQKKPTFISCGFGNEKEIHNALKIFKKNKNNKIVLLYCVSVYPPKNYEINLNQIDYMRSKFKVQIGFSDHSLGNILPLGATAKGVSVIEKHFTINKKLPGFDQAISADPKDLSELSYKTDYLSKSLGKFEIKISKRESKNSSKMRRSIVAARDLPNNQVIKLKDLDFKRFGDGISPDNYKKVLGKKLKKPMKYDDQFSFKNLK